MVTFICSIITNDQIQEYIGIVLMVLEAILVLIKFLQYLVEPKSKFGKFLSRVLKGITFVKDETKNLEKTIKGGEEDDRRRDESEDSGSGNDGND